MDICRLSGNRFFELCQHINGFRDEILNDCMQHLVARLECNGVISIKEFDEILLEHEITDPYEHELLFSLLLMYCYSTDKEN